MDQPVTITFTPEYVITWLIIGLIAGFLANSLLRGRRMSAPGYILIGLIGAFIGGLIFSLIPPLIQGELVLRYNDILAAFIGALIVLAIASLFWGRRV